MAAKDDNKNGDNLAIWDKVNKTDEKFTKKYFVSGGTELTSINSNYQIMRATELFGPLGIGWGYDIIDEKYIKGPAIHSQSPEAGNFTTHVVRINFWYMHPVTQQKGTFSNYGATNMVGINSFGQTFVDDNAAKKSITSALTKCLSMLGFSADIYSGSNDEDIPKAEANTNVSVNANTVEVIPDNEISMRIRNVKTLDELKDVWQKLTDAERLDPAAVKAKADVKVLLGVPKD